MQMSILLSIFLPSSLFSHSVSTYTADQNNLYIVSYRLRFIIYRTSTKKPWRGFRPKPSVGRTNNSHPLLFVISTKYSGFLQGRGVVTSTLLSTPYAEALIRLLATLQYSSGVQLPTLASHLQAPSFESTIKTTTLLSIYFSGWNSTSSSALHQPDSLSKYSFMTNSSKQQHVNFQFKQQRYFIPYQQRRLMLRGVLRYLLIPRTFFFLNPHIFSKRNTTDLSIRAFIIGSIARSTSAIQT